MAEDEIIKHTKKSYAIFKSNDKDWLQKLKEILIEILIIVFAVSVSIWLHNWSEKRHDQNEEKEFLNGLKKDLTVGISHMTSSKIFYENSLQSIRFFLGVGAGMPFTQDSINRHSGLFFNSTDLDPHVSRYEGLKSSGKFSIIENKELLNNIITFHESTIQRILELNEKHYRHNEKLEELVSHNTLLGPNDQILNVAEITKRSDFKILLTINGGMISNNIIPAHQEGINKCKELLTAIDEELK